MENVLNYPEEPVLASKILITGPLTPSIPYIVLKELALERNFIVNLENMKNPKYYIKVFKKVSKIKIVYIHNLHNQLQYNMAKSIVNPLCEWKIHELQAALKFLNQFRYINNIESDFKFSTNISIGLQTPTCITNINACVLYGICRFMNIHLDLDITYEDLKEKVLDIYLCIPLKFSSIELSDQSISSTSSNTEEPSRYSYDGDSDDVIVTEKDDPKTKNSTNFDMENTFRDSKIVDHKLKKTEELSDGEIIYSVKIREENGSKDSLSSSDEDFSKEEFKFSDHFHNIESIGELFEDIQYVRNQFNPINNEQAIITGAYVHHRDFSNTLYPLKEFRYYINHKKSKDKNIQYIEYHNIHYFDLNFYFNPYLPKSLYKKQILEHHLCLFSYSKSEYYGSDSYEVLQELYLEDNFYLGWHPNIVNKETPIELDPIDSLENENIICYGVRSEKMNATSWKELHDLFKNTNLFLNPFEKNTLFLKNKIERLSNLGKWILDPSLDHRYLFLDYKTETIDMIRSTVDLIESMMLFQNSEFQMFRQYYKIYEEMSQEQRENINISFEKLFELVMFMRGWTHDQLYPITHVPASDNHVTEKNTLEALIVLDEWNAKTSGLLYSLPLITWKNEFVKSNSSEQGFTIGDRIEIVKNGESDNINSCIRLTSNVLGASYCFYCKLFKIEENFDIKNLSYIS